MPSGPNYHTLLEITVAGVPPFSARGVQQTLTPIAAAASMRRTINGELINLGLDQFHKFSTSISCTDHDPPAMGNIWPGMQLVIDCVEELCFVTGGTPGKPVVPDSTRTANGFTFYRPRLTMLVINFQQVRDEYGHTTNWSLQAEEV